MLLYILAQPHHLKQWILVVGNGDSRSSQRDHSLLPYQASRRLLSVDVLRQRRLRSSGRDVLPPSVGTEEVETVGNVRFHSEPAHVEGVFILEAYLLTEGVSKTFGKYHTLGN